MGNIVDDGIGAQMSSKIDPNIYQSPRTNPHRKPKEHYLLSAQKNAPKPRRPRSTSNINHKYKPKRSKQHRDASTKPFSKRRERKRKRKTSITSTVSENDIKRSNNVVDQLVSSGYGTEKEVIAAYALSSNHRDIDQVLKQLAVIQSKTPIKYKKRTDNPKKSIKVNTKNTNIVQESVLGNNDNLLKIIDWINSTPELKPVETTTDDKNSIKKYNELSPKQTEKVRSRSLSDSLNSHILLVPQQSPSFEDDNENEDKKELDEGEEEDNFIFSLDPNHNGNKLDAPKFDPFSYSDPNGYKYKRSRKIRLELRNSISATSKTSNQRKIEALKSEIRESIESTLSEVSAVIEDDNNNKQNNNNNNKVQVETLIHMSDPPLLPATAKHLLYWNDLNRNIEFAVCCTGHHMFNSNYKSGVYLYMISPSLSSQPQLEYLCSFPDKVYANSMGMAIDSTQHKLHLFGGKGLFGQWLILNLKAKIWDIRRDLSKYKIPIALNMENVKCIVIESNLHIYCCARFLRYNRRKHRFIELANIKNENIQNVKYMFYVKKQKRIYVFGGNEKNECADNIYYCVHNETFHQYKWYKFNIKLPYLKDISENKYNAMIGFEHILFIFYYERKQVCCIDLVKEKKYVCRKQINIINLQKSKLINTTTNILHSLCMDHNGPTHNVLKLNNVLLSTNMV